MKLLINCFALLIVVISSGELTLSSLVVPKNKHIPPILKQCQMNDPNFTECLRKSIESLRSNLSHGVPELLIPPCEPLVIPEIRIKQNAGAISMESEYSHVVISGLSNFTLRDIYVDSAKKQFRADLWFPSLTMTSHYMMHGKILLMPLMGNGTASGNFTDVDATLTIKKKDATENELDDNGPRVADINVEFNIGGASVQLDNLFNGEPELGAMMNKFLNNNWREITAEIRPALAESIERILYGIAHQLNELYGLDNILHS